MKLPEIKRILKENKITVFSHLNKPGLIELLKVHHLTPEEEVKGVKPQKPKKEIVPKYKRLATIRCNPKRDAAQRDVNTGEEHNFPSI